nr:P5 protein [Carrot reovirus 1]
MDKIIDQANPAIKTTKAVENTPIAGQSWADVGEDTEQADFGDLVSWMVYHQGTGCDKFLTNNGVDQMKITGLPQKNGSNPYYQSILCCAGITAANYRNAIDDGANRFMSDGDFLGMSNQEAFVCCILSIFHRGNVILVSHKGGEYYVFRNDPNCHRTYVIGSIWSKAGLPTKYARINCTEVGISGMFKRVMYPSQELPGQPSIPDHGICQIYAYRPSKVEGAKSDNSIRANGRLLRNFELPKECWNDYIIPGMDNVDLQQGVMMDGTYDSLMDKKNDMLTLLGVKTASKHLCESLQNGVALENISHGLKLVSKFKPRGHSSAFVTTPVARNQIARTKLPTNVDKNRDEWLIKGAELAENTKVGIKPKEIRLTGLRHWYSSRIMNCSKKRLHKQGRSKATFLPGGLVTGTGLMNVVVREIVWCNNVVIPRYECYSKDLDKVRTIIMICETGNCNIPGRPYIAFDHKDNQWFTSELFKTYFENDLASAELSQLKDVIRTQMNKSLEIDGALEKLVNRWNKAPLKNREKVSPLVAMPICHVDIPSTINTRKYVDLSTLSSIWPTISGEDYQKDCQDKQDDEEKEDESSGDQTRVDVQDLLKHSYSISCAWKQPFEITSQGFILPCGSLEPKISHNLHQHSCMLPYLGELTDEDVLLDLESNAASVPSCLGCSRRYAHPALAELCQQINCPGHGESLRSSNLFINHLFK